MEKLLISFILIAIPIIYQILTHILTSIRGELHLFKKHPTCYYTDWLFIPFNFLLAYTINANFQIFSMFFLMSLIINWIMHNYWFRIHTKEKKESFMYNIHLKKITPAGIVHFIFQSIQSTLIFIFLIYSTKSTITYIECGILLLFVLSSIPSSKKIHGKLIPSDLAYFIIASLIILAKIIIVSI